MLPGAQFWSIGRIGAVTRRPWIAFDFIHGGYLRRKPTTFMNLTEWYAPDRGAWRSLSCVAFTQKMETTGRKFRCIFAFVDSVLSPSHKLCRKHGRSFLPWRGIYQNMQCWSHLLTGQVLDIKEEHSLFFRREIALSTDILVTTTMDAAWWSDILFDYHAIGVCYMIVFLITASWLAYQFEMVLSWAINNDLPRIRRLSSMS